jgi:hypothetical protein
VVNVGVRSGASVQSWVIQFIRGRSSPVQVAAACHREQDRWRFKDNTLNQVFQLATVPPAYRGGQAGAGLTRARRRLNPVPEADTGLSAAAPRRSGQTRLPRTRPLPAIGAPRCMTGGAGALPDLSPRRPGRPPDLRNLETVGPSYSRVVFCHVLHSGSRDREGSSARAGNRAFSTRCRVPCRAPRNPHARIE